MMVIFQRIKGKFIWYFCGGRERAKEFAKQRADNQLHCYDFPAENRGWKKYSSRPVYGNKNTGNVFDPYCFVYDDKIWMVVSARKNHVIDLLSSDDGIHWNQVRTLIKGVKKTWEKIVNRACIIPVGDEWHLFYTGQCGSRSAIGHIVSNDIMRFERPSGNQPVLVPTMPVEGVSVMNPCVVWNEKKQIFQMWYSGGEQYEPDVILYAESRDGNVWKKYEKPVLEKLSDHPWEQCKIGGCDVKLKSDGTYEMYYIGYQNLDVARICYATSVDGLHWDRADDNLLIAPSKEYFDSDAVYKPAVVEYNNQQMMWYNGRKEVEEYIGLAIRIINI